MERKEMIDLLIENLRVVNAPQIEAGLYLKEEFEKFIEQQEKRYEKMSDLQLKNIMAINFF